MRVLRVASTVGAVLGLLVATATPAGADPPKPTNDEARILSVRPSLPDGVTLEVVGGDAFLELHVGRGHTALVPDYPSGDAEPGPYLRFRDDGTVEVNERSAASKLNESRYGAAAPPADPDAAPRWRQVATDGTYAWHDHRIHWMSPTDPPVRSDGRIDLGGPDATWSVELEVDGRATTVRGELVRLDAPSPVPWYLLAAVPPGVLGAALAVARRRHARPRPPWLFHDRAAAIGAGVAAALAVWVGLDQWRLAPAGSGMTPLVVVVPVVALVAALVAAVACGLVRLAGLCAAAAALVGWTVYRRAVFAHAVLPTSIGPGLDRTVTAVALGVGLAVAVWVTAGRAPSETGSS